MAAPAGSPAPVVLTSKGETWLRSRLDDALSHLAEVAERMGAGQHDQDDVATYARLLRQVEDLTRALAQALSVREVDEDPSIVELGDEVDVEFPDGARETYVIVHPLEAPMDDDHISVDSPLSRAVLGRRPGERVTVTAPAGVYGCTILARRRAR